MTNDSSVTKGGSGQRMAAAIMRISQGGFNRMRSRAAFTVDEQAVNRDFAALTDHRYCLVVSYRRDGTAVPTPVWFALDGDRIYFRSLPDNGKTKRIRNNPTVLVAPCDMRGSPSAEATRGHARFLAREEEAGAEHLLRDSYGLGRRAYNRFAAARVPGVYVEVTPVSGSGALRS